MADESSFVSVALLTCEVPCDQLANQRRNAICRCARRYGFAMGASRCTGAYGNEIWLWHRAVRRVHGAFGRQFCSVVCVADRQCWGAINHYHRSDRRNDDGGQGAESVARSGGRSMWLLPIRSNHVGDGTIKEYAESDR